MGTNVMCRPFPDSGCARSPRNCGQSPRPCPLRTCPRAAAFAREQRSHGDQCACRAPAFVQHPRLVRSCLVCRGREAWDWPVDPAVEAGAGARLPARARPADARPADAPACRMRVLCPGPGVSTAAWGLGSGKLAGRCIPVSSHPAEGRCVFSFDVCFLK